MKGIATIILALYQLLGIHHGPGSKQLAEVITSSHSQPALELTEPVNRPAEPIQLSVQTLPLTAQSVYAVDVDTMTPLYSLNPEEPLPIASITKMTTALVVLEDHDPNQIITIPNLPAYAADDALLHVTPGQKFRFDQILSAALIPSDNDAADSLALADGGTITAFSAKMNRLVASWGISGVHYSNPSGLTDENNYATAKALVATAKLGLTNPLFAKVTSTPYTTISDTRGKSYDLTSTNHLFGDPRVSGIKTGFTGAAGQCFVALATVKGHKVITVVLGSTDRFGETKQLLDYIERTTTWK